MNTKGTKELTVSAWDFGPAASEHTVFYAAAQWLAEHQHEVAVWSVTLFRWEAGHLLTLYGVRNPKTAPEPEPESPVKAVVVASSGGGESCSGSS